MAGLRDLLQWRSVAMVLGYVLAVAVVAAPIAAEQAVENVRFDDQLGTVPVEVSLCHNGFTSLDTGILGTVHWRKTGFLGFGACIRVTQPPETGGDTLASYVDQRFIRTNAELVDNPDEVARAYGREFASSFWSEFLRSEALFTGLGLLVVLAVRRRGDSDEEMPWWGRRLAHRLTPWPRVRAVFWPTLLVVVGVTASSAYAGNAFRDWPGTSGIGTSYALPDVDGISFSSPQTREIASQVQPFIQKNTERLRERAEQFEAKAELTFTSALTDREAELTPRPGEKIVLAEADPQGSFTGTAVRKTFYPKLVAALGEDAIALRTISGDVTSNGTVAEDSFVRAEAAAADGIPTVVAKGDHDSERTVKQLEKHGFVLADADTTEVDGFRVTTANDPEFKTLFGGSITNPSGVSEQETGVALRKAVDPDEPGIVIVHQPALAAAYLGIASLTDLEQGNYTTPYDDGIPDVPPGTVNVGHSHKSIGPFVIWNTDGDELTWTVVDRLGTAGGVENSPTFNRFSTPTSVPLKPVDVRLQYFDTETGLQTGFATITVDTRGTTTISGRTDVGALDQR